MDFSLLRNAKSKVESSTDNRDNEALEHYNQALDIIEKFNLSNLPNIKVLKKAADLLVKSVEIKSNNPNAYMCLSYIMFVLDDLKTAIKYMKLAESFNPDPELFAEWQKVINNNISHNSI